MATESSAAFRRDLGRWCGAGRRISAPAALKLIIANPGLQAVLLLRAQDALQATGHRRVARAMSLLNLRLTGAEFVVGCRIGSGLVVRHPQGIVVGAGAVLGIDCTLLHRVTLGERYGDGRDLSHGYPRLGSRVLVGAGAAVLGGVFVGDDAVVGANAVVLCDVEAADVVVGAPARSARSTKRMAESDPSAALRAARG